MYIYLNGEFIEREKAVISPFDHGYLYGLGVFETIRTYGGKAFLLSEHLDRLNAGLREMGILTEFTSGEVQALFDQLSCLNKLTDSYIRLNVSAGPGDIGLQTDPYSKPTVIIFQKPLPVMEELGEKEAVLLQTRRNLPETMYRLKSHHFYNNVAAKRELGTRKDCEGVFLSSDGYLAEGITSNLFWFVEGKLYTPSLDTGILNGITRQFILKIADDLAIDREEGLFMEMALHSADEMFFTNSIQEIVPVNLYRGKKYPGKEGEGVLTFHREYQRHVSK